MTLPNSAEVQSFIDGFRPAAEQVASSLGVATTQLLEIGLRKQMADGVVSALGMVGSIIAMVVIVKFWQYWFKLKAKQQSERESKYYDDEGDAGVIAMSFLLLALAVAALVFTGYSAILHLIAPEWMLIQEIVSLIG